MAILGEPGDWASVLDEMIPKLLSATMSAWNSLARVDSSMVEDRITRSLCEALRRERTARALPFQVHTQQLALQPEELEAGFGVLDLVFNMNVPDENIYFCLEAKRLNVTTNGKYRSYASEYVRYGMARFVEGRYSRGIRQGGMIGYVLDDAVARAKTNVEGNVRRRRVELRLVAPYGLGRSTFFPGDPRVWETHHRRAARGGVFRLHHLLVAPKEQLPSKPGQAHQNANPARSNRTNPSLP